MFSKRKYARKRPSRKMFRPRAGKKNRILRPPDPDLVPNQEFDASGASVYPWTYVVPAPRLPSLGGGSRIPSLRQICAKEVGANSDALSSLYLLEASWTCWSLVWRHILQMGRDLPVLFRMFASHFAEKPGFLCHSGDVPDSRSKALETCLIPVRSHRVENVFSNISVWDFVSFVSSLCASVVVDCSKVLPFSAQQLLTLSNITTLVALDLSANVLVDDQFLYTLRSNMVEKKSKLKVLRICSCPNVTKKGVLSLFEEQDDFSLTYVESDVSVVSGSRFGDRLVDSKSKTVIPGTKWTLLNESEKQTVRLAKYPLAMKTHYLLRNTSISDLVSELIWDFKFFPGVITNTLDSQFEDAWNQRLKIASRRLTYAPHCYMKDPDSKIQPRIIEAAQEDAAVYFPRQGTTVKKQPPRKPKMVATDANSFFGI